MFHTYSRRLAIKIERAYEAISELSEENNFDPAFYRGDGSLAITIV